MGFDIGTIGMNATGQAIQTGMGLLLEGHNDKRQIKQQQKLQDMQIAGQQQMVDYNMMKQLQMWKDTNYGAQMEQMKAAGINPGLLYGMSGGGATTTGQATGNVQGGHAPTGGGEILAMQQMGIQRELLQAQKENIQANTEKTKAETGNVPLTGKNIEASTASITQGIENQKAQEKLIGIQDSLMRNELFEHYETQEDRFQAYANVAKRGIEEAKQAMIQTGVDSAMAGDKIKLLEATAIGQILKNALTKAETGLTHAQADKARSDINVNNAEIMKWGVELAQKWTSLTYDQQRTEIMVRVGKFHSAASQRMYDNILKGISTVAGAVKPGTVINQGPKETIIYNQ